MAEVGVAPEEEEHPLAAALNSAAFDGNVEVSLNLISLLCAMALLAW
jgi:hypothetical protein